MHGSAKGGSARCEASSIHRPLFTLGKVNDPDLDTAAALHACIAVLEVVKPGARGPQHDAAVFSCCKEHCIHFMKLGDVQSQQHLIIA